MQEIMQGYIAHEKADIRKIGQNVVVFDKDGKQVFTRPYTKKI